MIAVLNYMKVKFANIKAKGMLEYSLIIGVLALIVVVVLTILRQPLINLFTNIGDYLNTKGPPATP